MCEYVHTGALQVVRWISPRGVEPQHTVAEAVEVLRFADNIALLCAAGIAANSDDEARSLILTDRVIRKLRRESC